VEALAGPGTTFVGRVDDDELRSLYRRCHALLMPGVEDFGIVPVEAQACGAPVVAVDAGGARDSVRDGETGVLVPTGRRGPAEVERWADALTGVASSRFDPVAVRSNAESFSRSIFRDRMGEVVERSLAA
jgi:glycosyltransferase involved in cell wall biosynthesis